jgi:hypothetical protein
MANTIGVASKKILPYMNPLLECFHTIITQGAAVAAQNVKGQALMCAGKLASACGKEQFPEQAIDEFTKFALECLKQDTGNKLELRETAITYFSDLSVLIKEDMKPIFDEVMTEIIKTCVKEDEFAQVEKKDLDGGAKKAGGFSLDSDSEDPEELAGIDVDVN